MDIAALATSMSHVNLMQSVSFAVADKAIQLQEKSMDQMIEIMETGRSAPHLYLGVSIDVST